MESHGAGRSFEDAVEHYRVAAGRDPLGSLLLVPTPFAAERARWELVARGVPVHDAGIATVGKFSRRWFLRHRTDEALLERTGAFLLIRELLTGDPEASAILSPSRPPSNAVLRGCYRLFSTITTYLLDYPNGLGGLQSDRSEALGRLHRAYRAALADRRLVDPPSLRHWAARSLAETEVRFGTVVLYALGDLYPADLQLVSGIAGRADQVIEITPVDAIGVNGCLSARFADRRHELAAHATCCRVLVDAGIPPDDIMVALARDAGLDLLEEAFTDQGLACARSPVPLDRTRLGTTVLALLETAAHNWPPDALLRLLRSPCFTSGLDPDEIDLLELVVLESRAKDRAALTAALVRRVEQASFTKARLFTEICSALGTLAAWLDTLVPPQDREGLVHAMRSHLGPVPGTDEAPSAEIEAVWSALYGAASTARILDLPPTGAAGFLAEATLRLEVARAPARARQGAVAIVDLRDIAGVSVPYLLCPDLVEAAMPALADQVPFLTEAEAVALGLPSHTETAATERRAFARALAGGGAVYLSAPERDGTGPAAPSPLLEEVEAEGAGTWMLPATGPGRRECMLQLGRNRGGEAETAVGSALPGLRIGPERPVPVTWFDEYARCPFRWYAQRMLDLEPFPHTQTVEDWAGEGARLHEVLAEFYRRWGAAGHRGVAPAEREAARALALAVATEVYLPSAESPPAEAAERAWCTGEGLPYAGLLDRFLDQEVRLYASGFAPGPIELDVTLAMPGLGGKVPLSGRIDRLDLGNHGMCVVHDYKSGGRLPSNTDLVEGRALQLPLYLEAVEQSLGLEGVGACHYRLHRTAVGPEPMLWSGTKVLMRAIVGRETNLAEAQTVRSLLLEYTAAHIAGMVGGAYAPSGRDRDCKHCDFRTVCRAGEGL